MAAVTFIRSCHIGWTEGNSRSLRYAALRSHGKPGRRDENFVLKLEDFAREVNKVTASQDDDSVGGVTNKLALMGKGLPEPYILPTAVHMTRRFLRILREEEFFAD
jgi:hypothetical protein